MKGKNIGFMSRVQTKEELGTCEHVVIASPEPWEPTRVQLSEVVSLPSGIENIIPDNGSHEYLNPERDEAIQHSMQLVLVGLKEMLSE